MPLFTAIKGLYFVLIVLCITAAFPSQGFSDSEPKTIEIMPGGPPIPLIAVPEDFFFRVVPSPERLSLFAQLATFSINYISSGTNYFGDTCISWPTEARNAFDYTASIWATYLQSSVPITINACWSTSLASGVLGHSGSRNFFRNFSGAPMADTWYSVTLANALHGSDLDPGIADIEIAYGSTFSWYFATDGNPGSGQYDFVSVVLHEIAHGLGFAGSMTVSSGLGSWGGGTGYPIAYDRFTENGSGQDLINTSLFPNSSTALAAQLTSNNLYFNGTNADAANGGNRPKLYAPSTWSSGSSYAHLDEIYNGTVNALMTYSFNSAEAVHDPGPITMGIFKDVGWTTSSCTYSIDPVNSPIFSLLGGSGSFNITTQSECAWTATESLDWVTITSGSSGTGSGTVAYSVSSNAGGERSGAITISGQSFTGTHTITQSGQAENLIQNPGFESGNTVWIQESGLYNIIIQSSAPVSAHNGSWLTWFGGYSNASDVLYQQITIPSWETQAYVQFWYYIATAETSGQNDIMTVEIRRNSDNALLKTLKTFSNLDSTSGWVQSQQFDVTEFIGQTIRLRFAATLNSTNNTNFFIDDVTLMMGEKKTPLNDTAEFVRQQYRDFLNREADSGGLQYWVNMIDSGAMTKAQVIELFFGSPEFAERIAPMVRLYFAYFLRIPDYAGLMFWINEYNSGWSLGGISDFFASSPEFVATYGSLTNEQFVTLVYQNVLGRAPDAGGYAFWVDELNSVRRTRGRVMLEFSESTEYKGLSNNQVYVTMMYIGMLRRSPDEGGFNFWVNYLDSGNSGLALIDGFLNSQEYADRF